MGPAVWIFTYVLFASRTKKSFGVPFGGIILYLLPNPLLPSCLAISFKLRLSKSAMKDRALSSWVWALCWNTNWSAESMHAPPGRPKLPAIITPTEPFLSWSQCTALPVAPFLMNSFGFSCTGKNVVEKPSDAAGAGTSRLCNYSTQQSTQNTLP